MRFNDLTATVLAARADTPGARAILWRQCVDLLAQFDGKRGAPHDEEAAEALFSQLDTLRAEVPVDVKVASIRELGSRLRSERLARLLVGEESPVVIAAMRAIRLEDDSMARLATAAGPLARSILRERSDLGSQARRALEAFGTSDLALERPIVVEPEAELPGKSQIRQIVERIERFTQERRTHDGAPEQAPSQDVEAEVSAPLSSCRRFTFVTDAGGVMLDVAGANRSALVGLSLARPSFDGAGGVDGQVFGAFRKRTAIRDGRLTIEAGTLAGEWLINADPRFDPASGRFLGYAGDARLAGDLERAARIGTKAEPEGATATSLRQLIHELRTPLTGVMGFAELIQSQLLGPVDDGYRSIADDIVADVRQLVDILDDLDSAYRNDRKTLQPEAAGADAVAMLDRAIDRFASDGSGRRRLSIETTPDLPAAGLAGIVVERILFHFIRAVTACLDGETRTVRCIQAGQALVIRVARPSALMGIDERVLLDPGYDFPGESADAPPLGVGFTLRLVERLVRTNGGNFSASGDDLQLTLPVRQVPADEAGHRS